MWADCSIWTFKHHSWFSILVLNYNWILFLFFHFFLLLLLLKQIVSETIVVLSTNRAWIWMYMPMYGAVPLSSFSIWLHHALWTLRFGFDMKIMVRFRLETQWNWKWRGDLDRVGLMHLGGLRQELIILF